MTLQGINWGIVTWACPLHNYLFKITQNPHKIGLSEAVLAIEDIRCSLYGIYCIIAVCTKRPATMNTFIEMYVT